MRGWKKEIEKLEKKISELEKTIQYKEFDKQLALMDVKIRQLKEDIEKLNKAVLNFKDIDDLMLIYDRIMESRHRILNITEHAYYEANNEKIFAVDIFPVVLNIKPNKLYKLKTEGIFIIYGIECDNEIETPPWMFSLKYKSGKNILLTPLVLIHQNLNTSYFNGENEVAKLGFLATNNTVIKLKGVFLSKYFTMPELEEDREI